MSYNHTKGKFMMLLDGYGSPHPDDLAYVPPLEPKIDSWKIGICKLEVEDDGLHVYLRRPGLLIGAKGETLYKFQDEMECKIFIHEVVLTHD